MTFRTISPDDLHHLLRHERGEFALLDVAEEGEYGGSHLLRAINAPYSQLESVAPTLVPRRQCPVILIDHGHGVAPLAARRLAQLGYGDLSIVDGGTPAWAAAGGALFAGVFVPSKAFGEWVADEFATPAISADALFELQQRHADVIVLDPRTLAEHAVRHVPGARACPGAELVYRFHDLAPSPTSLVVVACGGRTRGIVGAQTLIDAGIPNPVVALEDGCHGWQLAGHTLENGGGAPLAPPGETASFRASQAAAALRDRFSIPVVDARTVAHWQSQAERIRRTTYVLDVRTPDEFALGSVAGAASAPGGQLLQATDRWLGTWNARVVLVDDDGIRATTTARWLREMGWDAHVAAIAPARAAVRATDDSIRPPLAQGKYAADTAAAVHIPRARLENLSRDIDPIDAAERLSAADTDAPVVALSLDASAQFLELAPYGPGWTAVWANRSRLETWRQAAREGTTLLLFSIDADAAHLAAVDLIEAAESAGHHGTILVVRGGVRAWVEAGLPAQPPSGAPLTPEQRLDTLYWGAQRRHGDRAAMLAYLDWEKTLLARVRLAEPDFPARPWGETRSARQPST